MILKHNRLCEITLVNYGSAFGRLADEFDERFGSPFLIPALLRHKYLTLKYRNHAVMEAAEAVGWLAPGNLH